METQQVEIYAELSSGKTTKKHDAKLVHLLTCAARLFAEEGAAVSLVGRRAAKSRVIAEGINAKGGRALVCAAIW